MSLVLWVRSVLRCQKVLRKVPPSFRQGFCTKVLQGPCGADPFRFRKGSAEGSPITSLHLSPSSFNSFSHFSPTGLALGPSAIVKVLGQNDTVVFWGSLQQMAFASQKVFWSPKLFCTFGSESLAHFGVNSCCFRKGSVEVSPNKSLHLSLRWQLLHKSSLLGSVNCAITFISQSPPGVEVA